MEVDNLNVALTKVKPGFEDEMRVIGMEAAGYSMMIGLCKVFPLLISFVALGKGFFSKPE